MSYKKMSFFLVMAYTVKLKKLEDKIKDKFGNEFMIKMAKDIRSGEGLLDGIGGLIKMSDLGIVVLSSLKEEKKVRLNIPFEYGILVGLGKPIILLKDKKFNIDISNEFSDISNIKYMSYNLNEIGEMLEDLLEELKKLKPQLIFSMIKGMMPEEIQKFPKEKEEMESLLEKIATYLADYTVKSRREL